jgi:tRNA(Ile)-lysidine synthase
MTDSGEIVDRVRAAVAGVWPAGGRMVLAASGGGDSTAMVSLLCEGGLVARERAVVAHFDHRLRGVEGAARERAAVEALCVRYGLETETGAWEEPRGGEAAAREGRYAFLREVALRRGATAVVTGHTSDDQLETVVMHSLRGAGLHGLAGMAAAAGWPFGEGPRLLRPLLRVSREETRAYCAAHGLMFADDPSNEARTFLRNRVRHELLPRLEAMAPGSREALLRLAEDARDGIAALEAVAVDALLDDEPHDGMVCLSRDALLALPPAVVPYAYRLALVRLRGDARDIERRHYAVLARAAAATTGSTFQLPRGVVVTVDPDAVVVSIGAPSVRKIGGVELPVPFEGVVGAWSLWVTAASGDRGDVVRLPAGAVVRGRRPGDRLRPAGMRAGRAGGHKKLQDYYVDRKVPRRERDAAPVIAVGREVLWTPFGAVAGSDGGDAYRVRCERVGGGDSLTSEGDKDRMV